MNDINTIDPKKRAAVQAAGSHRLGESQELQSQQPYPAISAATFNPHHSSRDSQSVRLPDAEAGMPAPPEGQDKTFTLIRPVNRIHPQGVGMEKVTEVRLRAPTALDLFEVGGVPSQPVWSEKGMTMNMDTDRLKAWLSRLSGLPASTLYEMHAKDLRSMFEWLNGELAASGN